MTLPAFAPDHHRQAQRSIAVSLARLGWIHGLSVVTIVSVVMGAVCAMKGRVHAHSRYMLGAFIGSVGAGIGALAPGRMLHALFFG